MARARTDAAPREELRIGYLSEVAHTYLTRLVREGAAHRLRPPRLRIFPPDFHLLPFGHLHCPFLAPCLSAAAQWQHR